MIKNIKFDMEGRNDEGCAFFALYAGLRSYMERKQRQKKEPGTFSVAGAEAYCLLQDLKESHPKEYAEAEVEYNEVYAKGIPTKPLRSNIIVEQLLAEEKTAGGIILPDSAKTKPEKGNVVAVGPGTKDNPMDLKVGDIVSFSRSAGNEIEIDSKKYLIMDEGEVLAYD